MSKKKNKKIQKKAQKVDLTTNQQKYLKIIENLKKNENSNYFRNPVNSEKLEIPDYYEIIKKPMDIKTLK